MAEQKKPEQKGVRASSRTPDKASPQPTGDEVTSPNPVPESTDRDTETEQGEGGATQGGELTDLERLQQTGADYFNRLAASAGDLATQARHVYDSSQSFVRTHPGQTVGGAFLAGIVLGLLMERD